MADGNAVQGNCARETEPAPAFTPRPDEPAYARLPPANDAKMSQWGNPIELAAPGDRLAGKSLKINGSDAIGKNPDRYKQHGFHFTADNCIGCHACEAACSEKNALPAHLSFRSVGYVEGGTYPDFRRVNISMACNHCEDPVCLKGCPTRAYTKFAEYGAVLQDPDICFGCGYCTWVCPYNAPQLDPVKGEVSKCNMCVDRLEVGLKPACASACLAGALDFGVVETPPEKRVQTKLEIPGFPDPAITRPNIRFEQTKHLPREMHRTDTVPLVYVKQQLADKVRFSAQAAGKPLARRWNLAKLNSRENPLVAFTLITQTVVGAFLTLLLGPSLGLAALAPSAHPLAHALLLFALLGLETAALALSTMHLGKPHRFYRAFNNLRHSPVSREVAGVAVFFNALGFYALTVAFPSWFAWLPPALVANARVAAGAVGALAGLATLYAMYRIYRIKARPYWDHWQVLTSFYGSTAVLGPVLVGIVYAALALAGGEPFGALLETLAWPIALGLAAEGLGLTAHARALTRRGGEGAAAHLEQRTTFGKTYLARNATLGAAAGAVATLGVFGGEGLVTLALWVAVTVAIVATAVAGRALFYAVVIPTTMPGAFFWKNRGFEEHARKTGLAKLPQAGIAPLRH
jgi:DMSO reductase iron-sulfur subunit